MPSATVTQLPVVADPQCSSVVHYYNGKTYIINIGVDEVRIVNCTDKTGQALSTGLSSDIVNYPRIIDIKYKTGSTVVIRWIYIKSGYVVIVRAEVDLSAKTVSITEEVSHNLTWVSNWVEIAHSIVIPPFLWVALDYEDAYLHYVNLDDGSDVSVDVGFGGYFPRPSTKYVALNDDIYMMLGRHYSGDQVYLLKFYSKSATGTGVSAGGGSPRPQIGSIALFYNDVIFPCGWGGVAESDNDIALFDHRMNHLGTLDLSSLTGWDDVDTMPGFTIFAKNKDGRYYALLAVRHSTRTSATPEGRLYFIEITRTGSIVDSALLHSFPMDDGIYFFTLLKPDYSDRTCVPVVDLRNRKIYTIARVRKDNTWSSYLVEIDISDIWDNIDEFNRALWFVSPFKIPTTLTLSITPL